MLWHSLFWLKVEIPPIHHECKMVEFYGYCYNEYISRNVERMNKMKHVVIGLFLYFPDDKSEYIPAAISCAIFLLAAIFTMRFIIRYSKKEELKTKQLEERIAQQQNTAKNDTFS